MPRLSAFAVRASLVYLVVGFTLGALMLAHKGMPLGAWVWKLLPAHIDFLLTGWMAQLALGVAFWILPRLPGGSRGKTNLAWLAFGVLNLGILLAALLSLLGISSGLLVGRLFEAGAAVLFALHAWERVRVVWRPVQQ